MWAREAEGAAALMYFNVLYSALLGDSGDPSRDGRL